MQHLPFLKAKIIALHQASADSLAGYTSPLLSSAERARLREKFGHHETTSEKFYADIPVGGTPCPPRPSALTWLERRQLREQALQFGARGSLHAGHDPARSLLADQSPSPFAAVRRGGFAANENPYRRRLALRSCQLRSCDSPGPSACRPGQCGYNPSRSEATGGRGLGFALEERIANGDPWGRFDDAPGDLDSTSTYISLRPEADGGSIRSPPASCCHVSTRAAFPAAPPPSPSVNTRSASPAAPKPTQTSIPHPVSAISRRRYRPHMVLRGAPMIPQRRCVLGAHAPLRRSGPDISNILELALDEARLGRIEAEALRVRIDQELRKRREMETCEEGFESA